MTALRRLLSTLALLAAGPGLAAPAPPPGPTPSPPPPVPPDAYHQICYQGPDVGSTPSVVAAAASPGRPRGPWCRRPSPSPRAMRSTRCRCPAGSWRSHTTSELSTRPAVTVTGAPGEYALTGIGAAIDWEPYGRTGSLLWKLLPRPDIGGAEVAGMDLFWTQHATITGYALGLKLVPP